jgi:hypothetical protein
MQRYGKSLISAIGKFLIRKGIFPILEGALPPVSILTGMTRMSRCYLSASKRWLLRGQEMAFERAKGIQLRVQKVYN